MKIEDKLEIVIPTFNRCEKLGITFSYLLGENSPVKNCDITILDNCSTDDTPNLVKKIAEKHPNVKYQRNARNIGANTNCDRAYEISKKQYVWLLGDDDTYDWECWNEVEKAIEDEAGAIILGKDVKWDSDDLRVFVALPGGRDIPSCIIFHFHLVDDVTYCNALKIKALSIDGSIGVCLLNKYPDLRISRVSKDIVSIRDEEMVSWDRVGFGEIPNEKFILSIPVMFLKDKELRDKCLECVLIKPAGGRLRDGSFPLKSFFERIKEPGFFRKFILVPWKFKIYLSVLLTGRFSMYMLKKLVCFTFGVKR